jgi:hypothetical protein
MKELKRPVPRSARVEQEPDETPRILSSEEKRELILAHARSQTGKDPMQRMTVWGGVLVLVAGIAVGWWWTVGSDIKLSIKDGSPELRNATDRLNEFTKTVKQGTGSLQQASPTNQADAAEFSAMMKAVLEGNAPTSTRDDLLAPYPKGASHSTSSAVQASDSSSTTADPNAPLIDPTAPGLAPDEQSSN